jgi:ABC-2 type transport system permease protein
MNAIFKWTVKQRKISTVWWTAGIGFFVFVNMIFYPSFRDDAEQLQESFGNLPDAALQLLGGSNDFFSPVGYINSQVFFLMLPLLLGILAISLGSRLLATEESDKTIEGLLARPISRGWLLVSKALAGVVILAFVTTMSWLVIIILARIVELEVSVLTLTQATSVCFLLVLSFGAIAYLLTATGRAKGASIGVATAVGFGGYLLSSLSSTISWLIVPSTLLPFDYYKSEEILNGTYNWANIWYFVGLIVACGVLSWAFFRRRDLA